jgi:hypothetical protein
MKKFYIMLVLLVSNSVFIASCGTRPNSSYTITSVASIPTKNCACKKNNNSNNAVVENISPSTSESVIPSESASPSPSISSSPSDSPTPLPSPGSSSAPSKDKKNIFGNFIEKIKNIFKKPKNK